MTFVRFECVFPILSIKRRILRVTIILHGRSPLLWESAVKGLASASTLVSPASSEVAHYKDIVSSMQGVILKFADSGSVGVAKRRRAVIIK